MTHYDALIAAWNSGTQPPTGVTGTGLNGGMTTAQKIAAVNAWTVAGSVPTTIYVSGVQVFNCIDYAEFKLLTDAKKAQMLAALAVPGQLLGGSANTGHLLVGLLLDFFPVNGPTIAALTALSKALPWWQATVAQGGGGLNGAVAPSDLTQSGLS